MNNTIQPVNTEELSNKEKKRAYDKARYEVNKTKIIDCNKAWYQANKDTLKVKGKAWYQANKDTLKVKGKARYETNKDMLKFKNKVWYQANKDTVKVKNKVYHEANKDKLKIYHQLYRENNKVKLEMYHKTYRETNRIKTKVNGKIYYENNKNEMRVRFNERLKTEPLFKFKYSLRCNCRRVFKHIKENKPTDTNELLGCTWQEAKDHFERLFQPGMTWANHGRGSGCWHVDHKIPIASATTMEEAIKLNHISNLQPLWEFDNLSKGAKHS